MGEETKKEEGKAEEKTEEKKEEEKSEEKKSENVEEKKEETKPPSPVILFVDLHCVGCAKKVERSIMKFRGVEEVVMDMAQNQVTIKGIVEPQAVCTRIQKKTKRRAKILSPLPAAEGEPVPEVVTSQSQVSGLTTVELNVNMHCEACAEQLKRKILKMRGVQTAETELSTGKVTVTGTMDADRLVDYVYKRTKKQARIVPQPEPPVSEKKEEGEKPVEEVAAKADEEKAESGNGEKNENNGKEGKEEGGGGGENKEEGKEGGGGEENNNNEEIMKRMMYYYPQLYVIERVPPPQLFSDENPNACCIT
ncbi:PREDICTED: heavy metal-associated isoprenylated plant protein 3-like [Nelumbo nucifera]|uniref:Heavy metal-associated isoprenylated plant protein 3-like n=1 Tax=Nelumbo nucifera TaxID=4432 RepID=A0A1U7ZR88_NELNU|nr:PREDICTED: heavy metal-associated isoprenylated plant protein 3-like [Nelumbo nucifera]